MPSRYYKIRFERDEDSCLFEIISFSFFQNLTSYHIGSSIRSYKRLSYFCGMEIVVSNPIINETLEQINYYNF